MKTPMQELIEHLQTWMLEDKDVIDNPTKYDERLVQYANQMAQVKEHFVRLCKSMLEKEKEVMCQFADEFAIECINFHHEKTLSPEQFFSLTFNTKEI